jgi:hypothetical protein
MTEGQPTGGVSFGFVTGLAGFKRLFAFAPLRRTPLPNNKQGECRQAQLPRNTEPCAPPRGRSGGADRAPLEDTPSSPRKPLSSAIHPISDDLLLSETKQTGTVFGNLLRTEVVLRWT